MENASVLSVGARHLPALVAAFVEAERQAREKGWIAPNVDPKHQVPDQAPKRRTRAA
jgi:hypothetical protein